VSGLLNRVRRKDELYGAAKLDVVFVKTGLKEDITKLAAELYVFPRLALTEINKGVKR